MATTLRVRRAQASDADAWIDLWRREPLPTAFQHPTWATVLAETFAVDCVPLVAHDGPHLVGVLPLYYANNIFAGRQLASFEGGALGPDSKACRLLNTRAFALAEELGASSLLLRGGAAYEHPLVTRGTTLLRALVRTVAGPEAIFARLSKRNRYRVRRALGQGYVVERNSTALDEFYHILARRQHALGTPNFSARLLGNLAQRFGANFTLYAVRKGGRLCGGVVALRGEHVWTQLYNAVARDSSDSDLASYALYWALIEDASASGAAFLDLGTNRSDSGPGQFKQRWSDAGEWVVYQRLSVAGAIVPTQQTDLRGGARWQQRLWQRLPVWLALRLGPMVRRSLPFA